MTKQYSVFGKKIDLYLPGHKLEIEIDGKGHMDRKKRKRRRENEMKKNLDVKLLELIQIVKNLIYILKLVKYTFTLMNQIKN